MGVEIHISGEKTLTYSDHEAVSNPTRILQDMSVALAAHRTRLHDKMRGGSVKVGNFKGSIQSINPDHTLTLKPDDHASTPKDVALTSARARQLLAADTTTRK